MKLTVFGGSGKTGSIVMRLAVEAGHEVTALVRNPSALTGVSKVNVVGGDTKDADSVAKVVATADAVVGCMGARTLKANTARSDCAKNAVAAMKTHGVKKLVWLSAVGVGDSAAQAKRASFIFGYLVMPLMLKENYKDADLAERMIRESGLPYVVTRPVGLTDKPATGTVDASADLTITPKRSYMTRADVAAWMLARAFDATWDDKSVSIW